ncbi:hypothetical protein [Nocardia sp. NPDC051570]|uniref:hypothetical protein n=1 Tax=Nocardia sp. NPDC051570 TaxID=3364324 RepID=UPI00379AF5C6
MRMDLSLARRRLCTKPRSYGGAIIREQRRLTDTEIDYAITSYQQGESLARSGQRLGVAHTAIRTAPPAPRHPPP